MSSSSWTAYPMTTSNGGLQPCVVPWMPVVAVRDMTAEFWVRGHAVKERRPPLVLSHYTGLGWANEGAGRFSHFYPVPSLPPAGHRNGWHRTPIDDSCRPLPVLERIVLAYMGEGLINGAPMGGCELHLARRMLNAMSLPVWQVYRRAQKLRGKSPWVSASEYLFKYWIELPEQEGDR